MLFVLAMRRATDPSTAAMVIDVKGAFLYVCTKRSIYIWLPPEDPMADKGYLGKLEKSMYGT